MQKIMFLTCFVPEITRGGGNFYPPPPQPFNAFNVHKKAQPESGKQINQ